MVQVPNVNGWNVKHEKLFPKLSYLSEDNSHSNQYEEAVYNLQDQV